MESLSLTEAQVLRQLLSDPTGNAALNIFLSNQHEYHEHRCTELLYSGQVEQAVESAHFAKAYETMIHELRHFIDNQLRRTA